MNLKNRIINGVWVLLCAAAVSFMPLRGQTIPVTTESINIFSFPSDSLFLDFEHSVQLQARPGMRDLECSYLWSDSSTREYLNLKFDGEREKLIWCQRQSAPSLCHNLQEQEFFQLIALQDDNYNILPTEICLLSPLPMAPVSWTWVKDGDTLAETGYRLRYIFTSYDFDNRKKAFFECFATVDSQLVYGSGHYDLWKRVAPTYRKRAMEKSSRKGSGSGQPKDMASGEWEYYTHVFHCASDTVVYNINRAILAEQEVLIYLLAEPAMTLGDGVDISFPDEAGYRVTSALWGWGEDVYSEGSAFYVFYNENALEQFAFSLWCERTMEKDGEEITQRDTLHVFININPWEANDTDSVRVFYPRYAYCGLDGDTTFCLLKEDTVYAATDTVLSYNLGPYNRDVYTSYQWMVNDTVAGTDSVFHYTLSMMDSVNPNFYQGQIMVRVATDSVWQDSCACYLPCDTCFDYDTVAVRLVRRAYSGEAFAANLFLPYDTLLCAHLDITLVMTDTDYHAWWLDKDSVVMPYGDTAEFTFYGVRGVDTVGGGTDTREKMRYYLKYEHAICPWVGFDTLDVINLVQPQVALPFHDTMICREVPIDVPTWHNLVYMDAYAYNWRGDSNITGTGECDFGDVPEVSIALGGDYIVMFFHRQEFDICGYDTAYDTIRILWVDPVMTDILLPGDTGMCPDLYIILDAKNDFDSTIYEWRLTPPPIPDEIEFDDVEDSIISNKPKVKIDEDISVYLTLIDTMECSNTQEIKIHIDDCTPRIEIPNVFTPNGDGINDIWKFKVLEKCVDVEIQVVNRWGVRVLKEEVPDAQSFEWNGCFNNTGRPLPDGPYFYMVSYKDMYGKRRVQSGSVSIIGSSEQ